MLADMLGIDQQSLADLPAPADAVAIRPDRCRCLMCRRHSTYGAAGRGFGQ